MTSRSRKNTTRAVEPMNRPVLRRHQQHVLEIAGEICAGSIQKKSVAAYVTPGGGKSLMVTLFAHKLIRAGVVDNVLILVPRDTLRSQMRDAFTVPSLGLDGTIQTGNGSQLSVFRGESMGFVTTYQDVATHPARWKKYAKKQRTLLVLDECHHLPTGGSTDPNESGWTKAMSPIYDVAEKVLCMTGSLGRGDKARIAFIEYDQNHAPVVDIRYSRRDALAEHAVTNISVKLCDGKAAYWHEYNHHEHKLSQVSAKEESRALNTVLEEPQYRDTVISDAIREWDRYRDVVNPQSRMIVVANTQKNARAIARYILDHHPGKHPVLAVSDEKLAQRNLSRFRDNHEGDILVTCQMAYEGLDVPDCTHLVYLTNIRSKPWMEQAFSRVTRFDARCNIPWETQCAFIYVPNDPSSVAFLADWLEEQEACFAESTSGSTNLQKPMKSTFDPELGEFTSAIYGVNSGVLSVPDNKRVEVFRRMFPNLITSPTHHLLEVARVMWPDDEQIPSLQ